MKKLEKLQIDLNKTNEQIETLHAKKIQLLNDIGEEKRNELDRIINRKGLTYDEVYSMIEEN